MKKRNGFVSNSSSASYTVKIWDVNFEDFAHGLLGDYGFCGFLSYETALGQINQLLEKYEEEDELVHMEDCKKRWMENLNADKDAIQKAVDDDDMVERVRALLRYHKLNFTEGERCLTFGSFTPMHNDYVEGVNEALQEILMYAMFERHYKVECDVDFD